MEEQVLNQEFINYFKLLSLDQKESLLSMIKSFLNKDASESQRISVSQYNKEISEAEKRINAGQFTTHDTLRREVAGW